MSGNYYSIDIWGLLIALVMVAVAAGISEAMRMGIGKTLLWSACRALLQLCAMGFIMEFVIKSNNPWLVLLLVMFMLIAAVQITLSRAKGVPKGLAGPVFLSLVITMLIMISLVTELIIRPQPWYAPQLVVPLTGMLLGNTVHRLVDSFGFAADYRLAGFQRHCDGAWHDGRSDHRRRQSYRRGEIPVPDSRRHRRVNASGRQSHYGDGIP